MLIGDHDTDRSVYIIAEIGANHEGDFARAVDLLHAAADCGANAAKFQTYRAEKIVAISQKDRMAHFRRLQLEDAQYIALAREAARIGITFLSTPFDLDSARMLDPHVPAFKIASGDLTYTQLLQYCASTGKPVILSTGMATLDEIAEAIMTVEDRMDTAILERLALLHCVTAYPTPADQANLRSIPMLAKTFGLTVGYSDHTLGIRACLAAVGLGARIIEKHFTFDKSRTTFRDHALSADPVDMKNLVDGVREIEQQLGELDKRPAECEMKNRVSMRRSLAARRDLPAGSIIRPEDLIALRPAEGIPPREKHSLVGRYTSRLLQAGQTITADVIQQPGTLAAALSHEPLSATAKPSHADALPLPR
jgi:N-acetylneuraminate synthase/N,N'-diacetyllegionaminate synthase